jgi:hypothetical protein
VYIFAVNHHPDLGYMVSGGSPVYVGEKADSRIEIFRHVLGSSTARHVRTVQHPLIVTPNDIFATSPSSFYVTNDHYYREGNLRMLEEVYWGAKWTTTVHVNLPSSEYAEVSVALTGLQNNNGLGHGRKPDEVLIGCAAPGEMHIAQRQKDKTLRLLETIRVDSTIDNPSYFADPFAASTGDDKSGFVLGGLSRAADLSKTCKDPNGTDGVMVWYVRPRPGAGGWEKKLLFQDDGTRIRSCSTAVLVAIDPAKEAGKRKAWLYVAGFIAKDVIAVKVDL